MSGPVTTVSTRSSPGAGEAALLAGLPGMGPRRLRALLARWAPAEAWRRATSGDGSCLVVDGTSVLADAHGRVDGALLRAWARAAVGPDPAAVAAAHDAARVRVLLGDHPDYPAALRGDVDPPAVLFARGDLGAIAGPRVAIVGTRRCTGVGAGVARELGHDLAAAGVGVVSGLALGIDGAAHRGVLESTGAAPVGVVGSGLDVVYPPRHRDLWGAVGERGVLLSEAPLGARPAAWRFPARNRVIAALADVVVVVESHAVGGSLHTVTEAIGRGVPVMAVPGSVRSPAAAGANQLLAEGCHPVRDATDILVALGLTAGERRGRGEARPAPDPLGVAVLEAMGWDPATLEHLAVRSGLALPSLAVALEQLTATGWVRAQAGWYEQVAP